MNKYWLALCVLASLVLATHAGVYIGTGRGVIQVIPAPSGKSYTLKENTDFFNVWDDSIVWDLEIDPRFPSGVFIHSAMYPNLVWDCEGDKFISGTRVGLYAKKNTAANTKNQRWVLDTSNRYGIIQNVNMVANVTQNGNVVLANKGTSGYQKFYPIDTSTEWSSITVNNYVGSIQVTIESPFGIYDIELSDANPTGFQVLPGSKVTFWISPEPYVINVTGDKWFTLPPPPALPTTPKNWMGEIYFDGDGYEMIATLTFASSGSISGSGSDTKYGAFTVGGSKEDGLSLWFFYDSGTAPNLSFGGLVVDDEGSFRLSGEFTYYSDEFQNYGQLYLVMQTV